MDVLMDVLAERTETLGAAPQVGGRRACSGTGPGLSEHSARRRFDVNEEKHQVNVRDSVWPLRKQSS